MNNKHLNTGKCLKCAEIFDRYPGFHAGLRSWFERLQAADPSAHVSDAGRGYASQEQYFKKGTSKAHYGQSAHNYNAALDIFRLTLNGPEYGPTWFRNVVGAAVAAHNKRIALPFQIKWYGDPDSKFYELPHCEVDGWKKMPDLTLVEPMPRQPHIA